MRPRYAGSFAIEFERLAGRLVRQFAEDDVLHRAAVLLELRRRAAARAFIFSRSGWQYESFFMNHAPPMWRRCSSVKPK